MNDERGPSARIKNEPSSLDTVTHRKTTSDLYDLEHMYIPNSINNN